MGEERKKAWWTDTPPLVFPVKPDSSGDADVLRRYCGIFGDGWAAGYESRRIGLDTPERALFAATVGDHRGIEREILRIGVHYGISSGWKAARMGDAGERTPAWARRRCRVPRGYIRVEPPFWCVGEASIAALPIDAGLHWRSAEIVETGDGWVARIFARPRTAADTVQRPTKAEARQTRQRRHALEVSEACGLPVQLCGAIARYVAYRPLNRANMAAKARKLGTTPNDLRLQMEADHRETLREISRLVNSA